MKKVTEYFDNVIMPLMQKQYPDIISEMSLMILGSVGLGIDDEFSDIFLALDKELGARTFVNPFPNML
jgi:hypothetical protein